MERLKDVIFPPKLEDMKPKFEPMQEEPRTTKVKIEEVEDDDLRPNSSMKAEGGHPISDTFGLHGRSLWSPHPADNSDDESEPDFQPVDSPFKTADFNDSDDDVAAIDLYSLREHVKPKPSPEVAMPPPPLPAMGHTKEMEMGMDGDGDEESKWGSVNQLVAFRETSVAIGKDYLEAQGIKLGKGRKRGGLKLKDSEASKMYREGIKDAQKIDVRGRRLKGADDD